MSAQLPLLLGNVFVLVTKARVLDRTYTFHRDRSTVPVQCLCNDYIS
jgi:hypothetical protein